MNRIIYFTAISPLRRLGGQGFKGDGLPVPLLWTAKIEILWLGSVRFHSMSISFKYLLTGKAGNLFAAPE
jgi:hypothetical protein